MSLYEYVSYRDIWICLYKLQRLSTLLSEWMRECIPSDRMYVFFVIDYMWVCFVYWQVSFEFSNLFCLYVGLFWVHVHASLSPATHCNTLQHTATPRGSRQLSRNERTHSVRLHIGLFCVYIGLIWVYLLLCNFHWLNSLGMRAAQKWRKKEIALLLATNRGCVVKCVSQK